MKEMLIYACFLCLALQEVAHLRKELLIAAKHILGTELRSSKLHLKLL